MNTKRIVNGERFWNPKEGLECGIEIIRLFRTQLADGLIAPAPGSGANPGKAFRQLEVGLRGTIPKVKLAVQECLLAKMGRGSRPKPLRLAEAEAKFIKGLHEEIPQIRIGIEKSKGAYRLEDLTIEFPKAEVRFTTKSYFEFIMRSAEEVLAASADGMLLGLSPDQIY